MNPFAIVTLTGSLIVSVFSRVRLPSKTMVPLAVPRAGDTKTSPHGRLPPFPGDLKSPSSVRALRPSTSNATSVPKVVFTLTLAALFIALAISAVVFWRTE